MKNYLLKIAIVIIGIISINSCTTKEDTTVNKVFKNVSNGAILRTVSENQKTFNFFDTSSKWSVTLEEQDATNGQIFREVRVYIKHTKGTVTSTEKLIRTLPSSLFKVAGNRNLPQYTLDIPLSEALSTLALTAGNYTPSDKFTIRLELVLTDGRVFSDFNTSTPVTNGYFNSSFNYSVQFFCPLANAADFNGNYKVVVDAWADYAVGDIIPVSYLPADGLYVFRILNTNNTGLFNTSSYYIVTINPTDATVKVKSNVGLDYLTSNPANLTNAVGTGTVGSCTGDINLVISYSGRYSGTNQVLKLVKI